MFRMTQQLQREDPNLFRKLKTHGVRYRFFMSRGSTRKYVKPGTTGTGSAEITYWNWINSLELGNLEQSIEERIQNASIDRRTGVMELRRAAEKELLQKGYTWIWGEDLKGMLERKGEELERENGNRSNNTSIQNADQNSLNLQTRSNIARLLPGIEDEDLFYWYDLPALTRYHAAIRMVDTPGAEDGHYTGWTTIQPIFCNQIACLHESYFWHHPQWTQVGEKVGDSNSTASNGNTTASNSNSSNTTACNANGNTRAYSQSKFHPLLTPFDWCNPVQNCRPVYAPFAASFGNLGGETGSKTIAGNVATLKRNKSANQDQDSLSLADCCTGDLPISMEEIITIRRIIWENTVSFPLNDGDLLVLDNIRAAHSRVGWKPGYERKLYVGLARPVEFGQIPTP
jgi:hypothetical protein